MALRLAIPHRRLQRTVPRLQLERTLGSGLAQVGARVTVTVGVRVRVRVSTVPRLQLEQLLAGRLPDLVAVRGDALRLDACGLRRRERAARRLQLRLRTVRVRIRG